MFFRRWRKLGLPLELLLGQNILKGFAPIRGQIWDKKVLQAGKGASAFIDAYAYAAVICGFCDKIWCIDP